MSYKKTAYLSGIFVGVVVARPPDSPSGDRAGDDVRTNLYNIMVELRKFFIFHNV